MHCWGTADWSNHPGKQFGACGWEPNQAVMQRAVLPFAPEESLPLKEHQKGHSCALPPPKCTLTSDSQESPGPWPWTGLHH